MAFVSGGGGIGGVGSNLPAVVPSPAVPGNMSSASSLRVQDAQAVSPRGVASLNASALTTGHVSGSPVPAAHLLYQQLLSAGAAAAQSQLLQGAVAAAAVSQATPVAGAPMLPQAAAATQQAQQQNQAFALANALAAAQGQLTISQLQLLLHNPLQQQVQAALAQLLNPLAYYHHLTALLQQSQLSATNHVQQSQVQVQNGISTPAQQQKMIENLLVEQAVRNSTAHDKIGISQPVVADNRNVGLLTSPESVKEHISRLISENEAILEQNPGLLKRRPYHRQVGSQSSVDLETGIRSQSSSPGVRDVRQQCTRSQTIYESHSALAVRATSGSGGSLTNGQPIMKAADKCCVCSYCQLKFPNEAGLDAHEIRCSKRAEMHSQGAAHLQMMHQSLANNGMGENAVRKPNSCSSVVSPSALHENRHPLKRRLLAAAEQLNEQQASTSKAPKLDSPIASACVTAIPIGISHPAAHYKAPALAQRCSNNVATAPSPAAVVATSHPVGQPTPANVEGYRRVYPATTAVQCTSAEANKPYILTLNDLSTTRNDGTPRRSRMRNITTETFATLNKPQPMFCEHKPKLSMYSNWQQSTVDSDEAKLNLLYMSTCSTKPRMGVKQLWRYTTALREMGVLKVTHSSFWDYSTKMRLRQNAVATAVAAEAGSQLVIATVAQEHSLPAASTSTAVSTFSVSMAPFRNATDVKSGAVANRTEREDVADCEKKKISNEVEGKQTQPDRVVVEPPKTLFQRIAGGYCTDEVYVYVRGRGRGRYVCDRCGIRCKKPSMLKKHIRSHSDIRPYGCKQCNFNFKTKGNLTKHLQSKTHRRRMAEREKQGTMEHDSDSDHDRLEIASPSCTASTCSNDPLSDDECSSDDEMRPPCNSENRNIYRKFGQENILMERTAHTPPTLWIVGETVPDWPSPKRSRSCHSAPPSTRYPSEGRKQRKVSGTNFLQKDSMEECDSAKKPAVHVARVVQTLTPTTSDGIQVQPVPSFITDQPSVGAFLAKETMVCDICKRAFRSSTEMTLHRKIHLIGPSNSRLRSYQCSECKYSVRSRNALQRHMEERHGIVESLQGDQNDSDYEEGNTSLSSMNPRSFMCTDCNIGFRKHGILAKHLRSKTHVMKLESLRIIPEDSLSLITRKEGGICLNEIDTTDCERARQSILVIISNLRDSSAALECREQMLHSPAPPPAVSSTHSVHHLRKQRSPAPSTSQLHVENKRLLSTQQHTAKRHDILLPSKPLTEVSFKRSDAAILQRRADDSNGKSVSANVWMPPKPDLNSTSDRHSVDIVGRSTADSAVLSDNGSSVRSDEANSEGAGRSESSTPTQRVLAGTAPSPLLPASTRCNLCEVNYESSFDLQVHLHADHVMLRDGKDFCCPKKQCDKVYPNRENLRQHIAAHYHGGGATPTPESREEVEGAITMLADANGDATVVLHRKLTGSASGQHANSAPNHSPSAPEESHTICPKASSSSSSVQPSETVDPVVFTASTNSGTVKRSLGKVNENEKTNGCSIADAVQKQRRSASTQPGTSSGGATMASLPCAICGQSFPDAFALQRHWLSHVCDRPHICKQCDAGFTTADALRSHSLTHQSDRQDR